MHIVDTKAGHFHPENFEDHYERALKELIAKKQRGEKIEKPRQPAAAKVINLMEALRQSAAHERGLRRREQGAQRAAARHRRNPGNHPSARARKVS
jgi:DNA end-binding protein Ku